MTLADDSRLCEGRMSLLVEKARRGEKVTLIDKIMDERGERLTMEELSAFHERRRELMRRAK